MTQRVLVGSWPRDASPAEITVAAPTASGLVAHAAQAVPNLAIAMAASPRAPVIYVANGNGVGAWRVQDETLVPLGTPVEVAGSMTCHLAVTADGTHLVVAHNRHSRVVVYPLAPDGSLLPPSDSVDLEGSGPVPQRQESARPHMIARGPGAEIIVVDLGADRLRRFGFQRGRLRHREDVVLPPGTGPRHLATVDSVAYVVGELSNSLLAVDLRTGELIHEEPCSDGPAGSDPHYPSAIRISAKGDRCYVANRGADTIVTFALDPAPKRIATTPSGGVSPWDIEFVGDALWVANRLSGTVTALPIDAATGVALDANAAIPVPWAVSLLLLH